MSLLVSLLVTRTMGDADRNYVLATWLRSRGQSLRSRDRARVLDAYRPWVERCLRRGRVLIACTSERPTTIHGWCCVERDVLRFVYVPVDLRRHGIARMLMTEAFGGYPEHVTTSHRWPFAGTRERQVA